ncbi:redoxin family protein [Streptobacillus moniliformis]|uniref:redoxin family protein n=1 Tax=Streptobacillus moniliformis TaxID=34105 RepID=UPI0007E48355|nr:redoxin family protein [Streptobacillus moniliformis]
MKKILAMFLLMLSTTFSFSGSLDYISFKDQAVQVKKISDYKGKTYIKMWASWCHICLATMPHTVELSKEKNLGFNVISVVSPGRNGELKENDFKKWFKDTGWTELTTLMDDKGELIKRARLRVYPTNVFLDSRGNIAKVIIGAMSSKRIKEEMSKIN